MQREQPAEALRWEGKGGTTRVAGVESAKKRMARCQDQRALRVTLKHLDNVGTNWKVLNTDKLHDLTYIKAL